MSIHDRNLLRFGAPKVFKFGFVSPQVRMGSGVDNIKKHPDSLLSDTVKKISESGAMEKPKANEDLPSDKPQPGTYNYVMSNNSGEARIAAIGGKNAQDANAAPSNPMNMYLMIGLAVAVGYYFYSQRNSY